MLATLPSDFDGQIIDQADTPDSHRTEQQHVPGHPAHGFERRRVAHRQIIHVDGGLLGHDLCHGSRDSRARSNTGFDHVPAREQRPLEDRSQTALMRGEIAVSGTQCQAIGLPHRRMDDDFRP